MAKISRPHKDSEPSQDPKNDDKVCIVIPRKLVRAFTYASTHIAVPIALYSFSPYLPSAQPKPAQCSQPKIAVISPHRDQSFLSH